MLLTTKQEQNIFYTHHILYQIMPIDISCV